MRSDKNILSQMFLPLRRRLWLARSRRNFKANNYSGALLWCDMTLEIDPDCIPAKALRNKIKDAAVQWATGLAIGTEDVPPGVDMDATFWLIEAERHCEASLLIRKTMRRHYRYETRKAPPDWLRIACAEVSFLEGDYRSAKRELDELSVSGPFAMEAAYFTSLTRLALGERIGALALLERFIAKCPWFTEARFQEALDEAEIN